MGSNNNTVLKVAIGGTIAAVAGGLIYYKRDALTKLFKKPSQGGKANNEDSETDSDEDTQGNGTITDVPTLTGGEVDEAISAALAQQEAAKNKLIQSLNLTQEQLKSQKSNYDAIYAKINDFEAKAAAERTQASQLEANYNALVTQRNNQTQTINSLREEQAYLQSYLASINVFQFAKREDLKKRLEVNTAALSAALTALSNLNLQVDNTGRNIATHQSEYAKYQGLANDYKASLETHALAIKDLTTRIQQLENQIAAI